MASATEPGPLSEPEAKSATQLEKELKTKRSRLAREARAKDRNAKRQLKAEAKRARKENVKRSGKWTKEHQLEIKDKMKALKPVKDEKKRLRLLTRSKMLEIQAAKLLEDSRRAAREYERMTAKKERAEAAAAEATAKKTEADLEKGYIALEDDDSPGASPDEGNDEDSPPKAADAVPADEVAIKKRRESDAGSVRSTASNSVLDPDVSMQDAEVEKPAAKESKKQSKKKSKKPSTNKASVEDPKLRAYR
ncbi:hypothetical protein CDD82_1853 [Ophiocordyceps australis]|uniref:Uncharacterized protein n=1 Tax=Ophiocordyceps australis TaxID=1399860 RepID=A0A2C5Y850_9HYPO|nr:hypothetical protein CDD82_1853 [Ophiocordyceps australis]